MLFIMSGYRLFVKENVEEAQKNNKKQRGVGMSVEWIFTSL